MKGVYERILQYGTEQSSSCELLSLILNTKTSTAEEVLNKLNNLHELERAGVQELCDIDGIGPKKAAIIKALVTLGRRIVDEPLRRGQSFTSSREVYMTYSPRLNGQEREEFWVVLLNTRNQVLREVQVARGTTNRCPVAPQDVFALALREKAVKMLLIHQHPSGDPEPSAEDKDLTAQLVRVGELVGVQILDHVVIGRGSYVSFADRGWV